MSKLNGLGKTHRERIFVVDRKLKPRSSFHYEQLLEKFRYQMNESSISIGSAVTKYLKF